MTKKIDEEVFVITYDGPALELGRMNVKDLAPALLALSDLIERTQELTQPESVRPTVHIKATHEGSFIVDLMIMTDVPGLVKQAMELFNSQEVSAALNAHDIVLTIGGAVSLLVTLGTRRKIKKREVGDSPGTSKITFNDGTVLEVPALSEQLIRDLDARRSLKEVVEPLKREGVTSFNFDTGRTGARVTDADVAAFEVPQLESEIILEKESEIAIQPVSITFQDNNKWKVSDGSKVMWAAIQDSAFLTKVENNEERFGKGDILMVNMKTTQRRTPDGQLRTDYAILQVLSHVPGARQLALPFEETLIDIGVPESPREHRFGRRRGDGPEQIPELENTVRPYRNDDGGWDWDHPRR